TYGTGCFMLMHTGSTFQTSQNGLLTTSAAQASKQPEFAMEGSVFVGGAVVQWLRDGLGIIKHAAETGPLADKSDSMQSVYLVP
ncbi:FGGY-family carbohydrate kinase, partial [Acinetobacter baumannii]